MFIIEFKELRSLDSFLAFCATDDNNKKSPLSEQRAYALKPSRARLRSLLLLQDIQHSSQRFSRAPQQLITHCECREILRPHIHLPQSTYGN